MDTSILCVWLGVTGKETCGPPDDRWDKKRVEEVIRRETKVGTLFVLPLASIIETGNHIAQSRGDRHTEAQHLARVMVSSADGKSPWAVFTEQRDLWGPDALKSLAATWPDLAKQKLSLGDATIEEVAKLYERMGHSVEIFTADQGLKAREPARPPPVPRRRR
ncbi:MAG TPA: hypothetical protein VLS89_19650 [Candidatus Nanopelagicales bacterium]|nr:hypothetical protein [Candidatus Nanopelagicales bacterium]